MRNNLFEKAVWFVFGTAIVLQFIMPFVYPITGYDAWIHLNWLEQFPRLFREGNLYPRWMPDSFWGFGSPAFYFYPPLTYWCGSLVSFINPSPVFIYQTLGLLGTIASVWTCNLYLRSIVVSKRSALMGALVYGVFPYRFIDLYLRNALGEHIAFVFLPLIFLTVEIALNESRRKALLHSVIISGIAWGGLFLVNIPTAMIVIVITPVYCIIRAYDKKKYVRLVLPLSGAFLGVLIAMIYLLPMVSYLPFIKLSHLWDLQTCDGNSGYSLIDIFNGKNRYFYIGLNLSLFIGIWLAHRFYLRTKDFGSRKISSVFLILLCTAIFLQIPYLSYFANIPLKFIQFPYRWNILIVLASSVYIALYFQKEEKKLSQCFVIFSSIVTIILAFGYFITMDGFHWQYKHIPGHIDPPEYVTPSVDKAKNSFKNHEKDGLILTTSDSLHIHILSATSRRIRFTAENIGSGDSVVIFHKMSFPTWELRSLGAGSGLQFVDSIGRVIVLLENEKHQSGPLEYSLELEKKPIEKTGELITCLGLAILSVMVLIIISSRNPKAS